MIRYLREEVGKLTKLPVLFLAACSLNMPFHYSKQEKAKIVALFQIGGFLCDPGKVQTAIQSITPETLRAVFLNFQKRLMACLDQNGGHVEPYLRIAFKDYY